MLPFRPLVLAALVAALAACRDVPAPAAPAARTAAAATFVGDAACASCHADLYAAYERTGMGRSLSRFDGATAPERFDGTPVRSADGYVYDAFARGDTLYQRERRFSGGAVTHELVHAAAYVVGSGRATRSYLMDVGGHLTEMPLTWYAERRRWDLSPGYAQRNQRFDRPIADACLTCHTATPAHSPGTQAHYTDVPLGISCERCHGPGSAHVTARLEGDDGDAARADPTIVHPGRLDRGRQLAVCQQCHLSGTTVFKEGEGPGTFRPGQHLSENRVVFAPAERLDDPSAFGISSHAQRLALSECYTASAMTCTTCHDPHRSVTEAPAAALSAACRTCHAGPGATPTAPARASAAAPVGSGAFTPGPACTEVHGAAVATANCASCHMQKAGTSDIPHVTFTDHWIRRRLPPVRATTTSAGAARRDTPFRLVRVLDEGETATADPARRALEEALALSAFYETEHRLPAYLPAITGGVRRALAAGPSSAEGWSALGRALLAADSVGAAQSAFAEGRRRHPADARLAYWDGVALLRLGRAPEAAAALGAAVAAQPRFVEARGKLGEALDAAGRPAEAEAAFRAALAEDSLRQAGVWNNLGFLLLRLGRVGEAARPLERAVALDPRLAVALVNLGTLRLATNDLAGADALFARALDVEPDNVSALANRGVIAARQNRREEARALFRRVVALSPADARARAMLAQLEAAPR